MAKEWQIQGDVLPTNIQLVANDELQFEMGGQHERHDSLMEEANLLGHDLKLEPAKTSHTARLLKWSIDVLRPAIFRRSRGHQKQLHKTAYLDGLRGFAAFMVYWQHHQLWPNRDNVFYGNFMENALGFEGRYFFVCIPGIRTFFTGGHFAVAVFFVISGYVLSAKPLNLIYEKEWGRLGDNLASALFRRWLRLHLPVAVVTFLYMTSWHAFGLWVLAPEPKATYYAEVVNWYKEFKNFSFVFRTGGEAWLTYGFHTWSIPVEFRGSIIIYTCLLAFSRLTRDARLYAQLFLIFYFMYIVDGWFCSLFITGMLLCEFDLLARRNELPHFITQLRPYKMPIMYTLFIIAAYVSGVPSHHWNQKVLAKNPGWVYLSYLKPEAVFDYKWFYLGWAATFLLIAVPHLAWLKGFFELRFNQYLGRISYSLYLVHGPILWLFGDRLYAAVGWYREATMTAIPGWIDAFPISKSGPLGFEMAFWIPQLVILPVTLWIAEIVTRLVDEPSVRFANWLYRFLVVPGEKI